MGLKKEDVFTVASIRCFRENKEIGQATGFFYYFNGLYLITNRHVLIDEKEDYYPDEIKLLLHKKDNVKRSKVLPISIYNAEGGKNWLEHPKFGEKIDVIALPINAEKLGADFYCKSFCMHDNIPSDIDLSIGDDVLALGYPLGFRDTIHNLPIARNATVASVYPIPFEEKPGFLIDSRLHSGTSGSPVLTKLMDSIRTTDGSFVRLFDETRRFFLGVHSETLDVLDRDPDKDEPLGLNFVWFAYLIPEIIRGRA
jgi:hypothetical protein